MLCSSRVQLSNPVSVGTIGAFSSWVWPYLEDLSGCGSCQGGKNLMGAKRRLAACMRSTKDLALPLFSQAFARQN